MVYKTSENGEKCLSVFPETQDHVLRFLILSATQRYSIHCQGGIERQEKKSYLRSWNCRILTFFFLRNYSLIKALIITYFSLFSLFRTVLVQMQAGKEGGRERGMTFNKDGRLEPVMAATIRLPRHCVRS